MTHLHAAPTPDTAEGPDVEDVVRSGAFSTRVQPVVECESGRLVGYEAVQRVEGDSTLGDPIALTEAVAGHPAAGELDAVRRRHAMEAVAALGFGHSDYTRVFLDASAESFETLPDDDWLRERLVLQLDSLRVLTHPATSLRVAERARRHGWTVALRAVGATPATLATLSLLDPEVVRLDSSVLHGRDLRHQADVLHAVRAHTAATGSLVLAEGVTTPADEGTVRMLGAHLAAGPLYDPRGERAGARGGLTAMLGGRAAALLETHDSPYTLVTRKHSPRMADKRFLVELSKTLEAQALDADGAAIVLSSFQDVRHLTPSTIGRYEQLSRTGSLVAMLGTGVDSPPVAGARHAPLDPADPLQREWTLVVITPTWATLLTAHDFGDTGRPDGDRRFNVVLTHDRDLAVAASRSLLSRVWEGHQDPRPRRVGRRRRMVS